MGEVLRMTGGYGRDVYIEAPGFPAAVEQGLRMIRKLGTFVVFREPTTIDWTIIGDTKEWNIHGSHLGPRCYPVAIRMLRENRLPMEEIVTHRLPLGRNDEGIRLVASGTDSIKVARKPWRMSEAPFPAPIRQSHAFRIRADR